MVPVDSDATGKVAIAAFRLAEVRIFASFIRSLSAYVNMFGCVLEST